MNQHSDQTFSSTQHQTFNVSSERYTSQDSQESDNYKSLNDARDLFNLLPVYFPTLEDAFIDIGVQNVGKTLKDSMELADKARFNPEIEKFGLTDDEAGAIACYTLESKISIYKLMNISTSSGRNKAGLSQVENSSSSCSVASENCQDSGHLWVSSSIVG